METAQMPWSEKRKRAWDWRVRCLSIGPTMLLGGLLSVIIVVGNPENRPIDTWETIGAICSGIFMASFGGWIIWLGIRGPKTRTPPDGHKTGANDGANA
jgi:hypothetical protein